MNDTQILTIVLATVPNILAVLAGILINNSRLTDLKGSIDVLRGDMDSRLGELRNHMDVRFNHVDHRFDDMRDMWRSELHRVEEIIDARLKHLEER